LPNPNILVTPNLAKGAGARPIRLPAGGAAVPRRATPPPFRLRSAGRRRACDALDAPIIAEASGGDKAACQLWHASCNVHAVQHSLVRLP